MKSFTISAPGKIHLLGEHTVVYGKSALLAAIDKRCFVTITPQENSSILIKLKDTQEEFKTHEKEILEKTKKARKEWLAYKKDPSTKNIKTIIPSSKDFITIAIGESLLELKKTLPSGCTMEITSEIPVGSGMGSSAAAAVAIAGSMSYLFNNHLDNDFIAKVALRIEQRVHGNPSGADSATSINGGLVCFEKGLVTPIASQIPASLQKNFSIVFAGKPDETTGEMVELVRKAYKKNPRKIKALFDNQEMLTNELEKAVQEENDIAIAGTIRQGEKNLESLGVASESVKKLIRKIEGLDGAAKICGAGGRKKASGIVLVFGVPVDVLKRYLRIHVEKVILGAQGVQEER